MFNELKYPNRHDLTQLAHYNFIYMMSPPFYSIYVDTKKDFLSILKMLEEYELTDHRSYQGNIPFLSNSILQWCKSGRDGVSNHRRFDRVLNRLFRRRSMKATKLRVTDLCERNSPVTSDFPAQKASNAENISIWWRYHDVSWTWPQLFSNGRIYK